jgi:aminoglycoside phosphotransferase (APT) family kinase protein
LGDGGLCAVSTRVSIAFMQIDLETAKSIIAKQFPQWAELDVSMFESSGTDHLLCRLGDHMAARFPITGDAARVVEDEWTGLRRFTGLPLATPQLLATAKPLPEFPYSWSVVNWIEGQDASVAAVSDWTETARNLGKFVRALRAVEPCGGRMNGPANGYRGSPLCSRNGWVRKCFESVSDLFDLHAMRAAWEEAMAAPVWEKDPVWIHGDIHAANIIVRNGGVVGIVDFGLAALGDPACDLALAWTFLPADSRAVFFKAAEIDGATLSRGKGWALYVGAIALAYYRDRNPILARIGTQAIKAVLGFQRDSVG